MRISPAVAKALSWISEQVICHWTTGENGHEENLAVQVTPKLLCLNKGTAAPQGWVCAEGRAGFVQSHRDGFVQSHRDGMDTALTQRQCMGKEHGQAVPPQHSPCPGEGPAAIGEIQMSPGEPQMCPEELQMCPGEPQQGQTHHWGGNQAMTLLTDLGPGATGC